MEKEVLESQVLRRRLYLEMWKLPLINEERGKRVISEVEVC